MNRPARLATAVLTASAALLLTACGSGGGDGSSSDKIKGADTGRSSSPSPSVSASAGKNAPNFALPSDIKVTVERQPTGDATKDAILRDLAYSAQSNLEAFAKGNGRTVNMNRYFAVPALTYWGNRVAKVKKDGLTITGDYRFYDFEVTDVANNKSAAGRYCEDQRKAYGKEIKTGKELRTKPSDKDFILNTFQVAKDTRGDWQVVQQSWKKADPSCVQG
ncbi:hypothetical protein [Streptomyces sp. NPDC048419]|uniref:hypothetical protein n=1 Tax=Streptomyces sp. NPDC048419 TaxID=3365547 RepID=UPI003711875A